MNNYTSTQFPSGGYLSQRDKSKNYFVSQSADHFCTLDAIHSILEDREYRFLMKNFNRNGLLGIKDDKIYLYPIEIVGSFCDLKLFVNNFPDFKIRNRICILNLNSIFGEDKEYEGKKLVKKLFRQVLPRCFFKGMEVRVPLEEMFRLYEGFRKNINNNLESFERIYNNIFTAEEINSIRQDLEEESREEEFMIDADPKWKSLSI